MNRSLAILIFIACGLTACYSLPAVSADRSVGEEWVFPIASSMPAVGQEEAASDEEVVEKPAEPVDDRSLLGRILLYLPNRVVDLFDIARAGVSVGLGIGVDLTATEYLNATLMTRVSAGLGYQTLRHLPIEFAPTAGIGFGPIKGRADPGLSWHRSPGDIRVELFIFFVGAHVAVEPFEIFDFVVGFVGFDPMDDNF